MGEGEPQIPSCASSDDAFAGGIEKQIPSCASSDDAFA
jgi:hypothetical protein